MKRKLLIYATHLLILLAIALLVVNCVGSSRAVASASFRQSDPQSEVSDRLTEEEPESPAPSSDSDMLSDTDQEDSSDDDTLSERSDHESREGKETEEEKHKGKEADSPLPAKEIAPLDHNSLMLAVIQEAGSRFTPIRKEDGSPLMIAVDLDQNGQVDPIVLSIEKGKASPFLEDLTDVGSLYDPEQEPVNYYLSVYFQIQGKLVSMYRIPFGGRRVLGNFSSFSLQEEDLLPLAIEVSFQNKEGTSIERVIFSQYNRFSIFSSSSTVSTGSYMDDINEDGILDLIEWKTGIEEGTGYETYLTWYQWNGSAYRETSHTNIVRNLNRFLVEIESALLGSSLDAITSFLPEEEIGLLNKIEEEGGAGGLVCQNIRSIIYPPILESPFRLDKPGDHSFLLDLRLLCETGETHLFKVRIILQRNPFVKPQFTISLR